MHILVAVIALLFLMPEAGLSQTDPLPACEWCGANEAPANSTWETILAGPDEPGDRLVIKGKVVRADGKTVAPGVLLYVYHTNAKGHYAGKEKQTGNGRRHGALRGWMKTNGFGEFQFSTIRPAPYPNRTEPAHIHMTVKEPGKDEYWIDSFVFDDDPLLTPDRRKELENRGGSGIIAPERNPKGVLEAYRIVILRD